MLLKEAADMYQQHLRNIEKSSNTINGYRNDLTCFDRWLEEKYNCPAYLDDISEKDIEEFLMMLKDEKQYMPASRRRVSISIRMFFRHAYKKKWCQEDITADMETIKVPQKERSYLTEEEVMIFAAAIKHTLIRFVVLTIFYSGLRVTESVNLRKEHVNLETGMITVIQGKGAKDRRIPISPKLAELVADYQNWRVDSEYFFATKKTGRVSKGRIDSVIKQTLKSLGWNKKVTAHTFRHSFASRLVTMNVNIVSISKLMGHADIKATSVYTHVNMDQLKDAVNVL